MAVEAHHLHLFSRVSTKTVETQQAMLDNAFTGLAGHLISRFDHPRGETAPSNSGVSAATGTLIFRKRPRDPTFLPSDNLSGYPHQELLDLDRLLAQNRQKLHTEFVERWRRFAQLVVSAVEEGVSKRLKAKDEEIEREKRINWALEEKIRKISIESQIWRELAQTNEAAANVLRSNLEHLLAVQLRVKEQRIWDTDASGAVEDAESCCCGESEGQSSAKAAAPTRACRVCWERDADVLVLPCRHLSLCSRCGPLADLCPVCNGCKAGSVNVYLT
ncbi:hypothetical protein HPP92_013923 [Vanilla planifolia]|uniref:RING-type domain-containing protein n=1 Tax=Vanilla planifolia TaxID=51239 RepID=A0A835UWY3_VANPL|nr:hypothetical protein HPP92_013923 [Vanilla planifolia]